VAVGEASTAITTDQRLEPSTIDDMCSRIRTSVSLDAYDLRICQRVDFELNRGTARVVRR
jgi:hypothetical protein